MFCSHCGKEVSNEAYVCPNCGCLVSGKGSQPQEGNSMMILGFIFAFFFPIIGMIFCSKAQKIAKEGDGKIPSLVVWGSWIAMINFMLRILMVPALMLLM